MLKPLSLLKCLCLIVELHPQQCIGEDIFWKHGCLKKSAEICHLDELWTCALSLFSPPLPFSLTQSLPAWDISNQWTRHMRWPKYWSFSFSISPSNEHPGLISFRMDWLDLLASLKFILSNILEQCISSCLCGKGKCQAGWDVMWSAVGVRRPGP